MAACPRDVCCSGGCFLCEADTSSECMRTICSFGIGVSFARMSSMMLEIFARRIPRTIATVNNSAAPARKNLFHPTCSLCLTREIGRARIHLWCSFHEVRIDKSIEGNGGIDSERETITRNIVEEMGGCFKESAGECAHAQKAHFARNGKVDSDRCHTLVKRDAFKLDDCSAI